MELNDAVTFSENDQHCNCLTILSLKTTQMMVKVYDLAAEFTVKKHVSITLNDWKHLSLSSSAGVDLSQIWGKTKYWGAKGGNN